MFYQPKQVTLGIFVLDNFMFYNDISIMYLDNFVCEADLHILMFQIIYCLSCRQFAENLGQYLYRR